MTVNYAYPIDPSWTSEELLAVMDLLTAVEKAYEGGIALSEAKARYQAFHEMGFSISDEKQLNRDFQKVSGYSLHALLVACREGQKFIRLKVGQ